MARPKPAEERQTVKASIRLVPYFAAECDLLPGVRGVGETPEKALASMRAEIRHRFPFNKYDIEETVLDR